MKKIFKKIYKHGFWGSIKVFYRLILGKPWMLRFRFYRNLFRLILNQNFQKKRILGIYDLKTLPWDVGDPLVFVETLNVLKIKHKAEKIDICVIYDRECPGYRVRKSSGCNLTSENAQDYILELLPLFSTCQYLGSVYQFNSRKEFYRFFKKNIDRYDIFPSLGSHLGEVDIVKGMDTLNPMAKFYDCYGYIPYLRIGKRDGAFAKWLLKKELPEGAIPVAISLKGTSHRVESNADPKVWLSFIDKCKLDFPEIIFVVVGLREEVFEGLRSRSNVFISKDFGTSIIEDLALIRSSLMYMGTISGVNTISLFSDLPYLIIQFVTTVYLQHDMKIGDRFSFMTDTQKILSADIKVTSEMLFKEFKEIYLRLDKSKLRDVLLRNAYRKQEHPMARVAD